MTTTSDQIKTLQVTSSTFKQPGTLEILGILPMLLPQMPVEMFRQTENLRTVLHQAWVGTPVDCSVFPHHFNKIEYLPTLWAGAICYWRNWLVLGLQMFHQCLLCVVALATGQAVVGILYCHKILCAYHRYGWRPSACCTFCKYS